MTRGLSLNNPFNIRITQAHWVGKVDPSRDAEFEEFDSMPHGLRAGFKNLLTAEYVHGRNTVRKIITAYAPPSENDTYAYVANVCERTGWLPDAEISLRHVSTLVNMGMAICCVEQGHEVLDVVSAEMFEAGAYAALG